MLLDLTQHGSLRPESSIKRPLEGGQVVVDACRVEEALHTQHVHRYLDLAQVDAEAPGDDAHVAPLVARAMRDVVLEDASVQGIQWHIIVIKLKFKSQT